MNRRELAYVVGWSAAVMVFVTGLPYFVMWWYTPLDGVFPGVLFNSDDHGVYYAWMRQARDGHFFFRNLFTTVEQRGVYVQFYFLLLGWLSRFPGLDIPLAYHLGRGVFGALTLVLAYRLGSFFTEDPFTRRCVFWVTALSGGLGWTVWANRVNTFEPVDVWQPEALTFPSLYTNGLFCVSLALMLGVVICLLLAERHGWPWAVGAGLCGLLLGNIHSYDVIHLALAWALYLLSRWGVERRFPAREFGLACLAAAVAAPSVAYMAWLYKTEPVFKARADTATWSHNPLLYLAGFGLLVPLSVWGGLLFWSGPGGLRTAEGAARGEKRRPLSRRWAIVLGAVAGLFALAGLAYEGGALLRSLVVLIPLAGWVWLLLAMRAAIPTPSHPHPEPAPLSGAGTHTPNPLRSPGQAPTHPHSRVLLPIAWAAAGLIAAYLPFAFQRKMVMGTHLPLALLAGLAVADLARRLGERLSAPRRVPLLAGLLIAALSITSARWLVRDVVVGRTEGVTSTSVHPVYWPSPVIHAFEWLGRHTGPNAVLLAFPLNGVLAPAYSGRAVYAGHWGETPYFTERIAEAKAFYRGRWSSEERLTFLRWHHITHVLVSPQERLLIEQGSQQYSTRPVWQEPFLKPVFTEGDTTLYEVRGG